MRRQVLIGTASHALDVAEWPFEPAPYTPWLPYVLLQRLPRHRHLPHSQPTTYRSKVRKVEERAMWSKSGSCMVRPPLRPTLWTRLQTWHYEAIDRSAYAW